MAKSMVVSCDLTGEPNAEPHRITLDGQTVSIDLAAGSYGKLVKFLEPYFSAGRTRENGNGNGSNGNGHNVDNAAVRAWAKSNRIRLSDRGRIPADVIERYVAATQQAG